MWGEFEDVIAIGGRAFSYLLFCIRPTRQEAEFFCETLSAMPHPVERITDQREAAAKTTTLLME